MTATVLAFMSLGITEIAMLGFVALLVYGGDLPEIMRNFGRGYAKFRKAVHEMTQPVRQELEDIKRAPEPDPVPAALPAATSADAPPDEEEDPTRGQAEAAASDGTPDAEVEEEALPEPFAPEEPAPQPSPRPRYDLDEPPPV